MVLRCCVETAIFILKGLLTNVEWHCSVQIHDFKMAFVLKMLAAQNNGYTVFDST